MNLNNIFSVKNSESGYSKIITFFGMKFEIDITKKYKKILDETAIDDKKILFANFGNKGYGCNPKYIAEEIIRQKLPYKLVWLVKNPKKERRNFPKEIKLVKASHINEIREHASAKIWISNQRKINLLKKRLYKKPEQFYIQTWHGGMPIKKIERDCYGENTPRAELSKLDSSYIDCLFSSSVADKKHLESCFYYNGKITEFGIPRNDIFFYSNEKQSKIREKVFKSFNINKENKVVLYAPTFRDDKDFDCYKIDVENILKTLSGKFGSKWILLMRLHPNISRYSKKVASVSKNIINATNYPDMQELLCVSDILITDYSSTMFEFILSKKPVFLFANDLKKYTANERGLYMPIDKLPLSLAQDNETLLTNIKNFDNEKYKIEIQKFMDEKGFFDDGNASQKVVELIKTVLNN